MAVIKSVFARLDGEDYRLEYNPEGQCYQAQIYEAEEQELRGKAAAKAAGEVGDGPDSDSEAKAEAEPESFHGPVMLTIIDSAGNTTVKAISALTADENMFTIDANNLKSPEFIIADRDGTEKGYLQNFDLLDMEIGDKNDFSITMSLDDWEEFSVDFGYRLYAYGTEYGGIIGERHTSEKSGTVEVLGYTWRGLLEQKIIQPPAGQAYRTVSGEANSIISSLINGRFGGLYRVEGTTGIHISAYQFERYTDMLTGIEKMLAASGAKLQIKFIQETGTVPAHVSLCAVPIVDWSNELEYSSDCKIAFTTKDNRNGINHLICGGKGELAGRLIRHLYVQSDGSLGTAPYYTGIEEREAFCDYASAENEAALIQQGKERLEELKNSQEINMSVEDADVELGDIVGGRERITGFHMSKPVVRKILKITGNTETIEYKVGD